jgi:hypothetical protein
MIKFIVHIQEDTGQILRITFPQRDLPVEGVENGVRIVHVTEENLPSERCGSDLRYFINEHWWVNGFIHLGKKPNKHATWDHVTSAWVWDTQLLLADIRTARNAKLRQSDWTQMPDSALSTEQKTAWATYRQALRDFPATITTESTLEELVWPIPP